MDYESMRSLADSWGLVYLVAIFVGVIFFTFRPGTKDLAERNAQIPLVEDEKNGEK